MNPLAHNMDVEEKLSRLIGILSLCACPSNKTLRKENLQATIFSYRFKIAAPIYLFGVQIWLHATQVRHELSFLFDYVNHFEVVSFSITFKNQGNNGKYYDIIEIMIDWITFGLMWNDQACDFLYTYLFALRVDFQSRIFTLHTSQWIW